MEILKENRVESLDLGMKKVADIIFDHLINNENIDFCSDKTDKRKDSLVERLEALPFMDKHLEVQYSNDLIDTINCASFEGFDTGLQVGLSLVRTLLLSETPIFHTAPKPTTDTPSRSAPTIAADSTEVFKKFMNDAADKLTEEELWRLIGRTETYIEKHREQTLKLF